MYGIPKSEMEPFEPSGYRVHPSEIPEGPGFFDKQFVISKQSLWILAGLGALLWYNKKK